MSREHSPRKIAQLELANEIGKSLPNNVGGIPLDRGPLTLGLRRIVVDWIARNSPSLDEREKQIERGREMAIREYKEIREIGNLMSAAREFVEIRKDIFTKGYVQTQFGRVESMSVGSSTEYRVVEWNMAKYIPETQLTQDVGPGSEFAKKQWRVVNLLKTESGLEIDEEGLKRLKEYFNPLNDELWSANNIDHSWDRHANNPKRIVINESEGIEMEFSSECHPTWGWSGRMHFTQRETPELVNLRREVRKNRAREFLGGVTTREHLDEEVFGNDEVRVDPNQAVICKDGNIGYSPKLTARQFTPWLKKNGYKRLIDGDIAKQYGIEKDRLKRGWFYISDSLNGKPVVINVSTSGQADSGKYYLNITAYTKSNSST